MKKREINLNKTILADMHELISYTFMWVSNV
jgi:hypothetical protein